MKKIVYLALLVTLGITTSACGKRTDAYYSTETQDTEVNGTAAERKQTAEEKELLTVSDIEKLDLGKYIELGNYQNVYEIPDGALDDTGNDKEDYENRKKVLNNILTAIVQNSNFTNIDSLVGQKNTELLVQSMNAATKKKETLSQYAAELGYASEEKLKENLQTQAEDMVKQELVVYALAKELQITVTDQQYTDKAQDLVDFNGYTSIKEMIEAIGTDQIRYEIVSYTSVGIATKLISENGKEIQIDEHLNTPNRNNSTITNGNGAGASGDNGEGGSGAGIEGGAGENGSGTGTGGGTGEGGSGSGAGTEGGAGESGSGTGTGGGTGEGGSGAGTEGGAGESGSGTESGGTEEGGSGTESGGTEEGGSGTEPDTQPDTQPGTETWAPEEP